MRRITSVCIALVGLVFSGCGSGIPGKFKSPRAPVQYVAQQPQSWTLANGVEVRYIEDRELPVIKAGIYLPGGQMWETAGDLGLTEALGVLWREGGTESLAPDVLDRRLEELAATITTAFGGEFGAASFDCLEGDLDIVSAIFKEVVFKPRFDESRLSLWKGQEIDSIKRRADDPESVVSITGAQLLFKGYRPGMVTTTPDIKRITSSMLRSQYKRFLQPKGAVFAISGAIDFERAKKLAEDLLGDWNSDPDAVPLPELAPIPQESVKGVYFVKGPYTQASILLMQRGVRRLSPDFADIEIFNEIFGASGFSSRLFKTVRTKMGLAYSVYGGIYPGRRSGQNIVMIQTKGESVGLAISGALDVLKGISASGVTATEVADAKRAIINGFVFQLDSTSEVLTRAISQRYSGYPADFDMQYLQAIPEVDQAAVRRVAEQRWNPADLLVVVAGDETAYNSLTQALKDVPELNAPVQVLEFDEAAKLR